jgi:hypothetical protein
MRTRLSDEARRSRGEAVLSPCFCASESGIEQTADARHAYFCQCPSTSVDRRLRNPEPRLDAPPHRFAIQAPIKVDEVGR